MAIAETMNKEYESSGSDSHAEPLGDYGGWAIDVTDADCVLGRSLAVKILEKHGSILLQAADIDDKKRMWFGKLDSEEVTKTVEVTEEQYTIQ